MKVSLITLAARAALAPAPPAPQIFGAYQFAGDEAGRSVRVRYAGATGSWEVYDIANFLPSPAVVKGTPLQVNLWRRTAAPQSPT